MELHRKARKSSEITFFATMSLNDRTLLRFKR
jgi:hypothetical protein